MKHARRSICGFFLIISSLAPCLLPGPCRADAAQANAAAIEAERDAQEKKFIQELGDKATDVLVDSALTHPELDAKLHEMLNSAFDVEAVGEFVIGRTWVELTPPQRQEYQKLFKKFVLRNYGNRLRLYNGEKVRVTRARADGERTSVISTEIVPPSGGPITYIDWVVRHRSDGKLSIVDVIIDGVSQSVTQREEFASILSRNGGNVDALLGALRESVREASLERSEKE